MHKRSSSSEKPSRQLPGLACEECRKRKLRCDRLEPQCSVCSDAGIACFITSNRSARGPQRGHLKALQARIGTFTFPNSLSHLWSFLSYKADLVNSGADALEESLTQKQMTSTNSIMDLSDHNILDTGEQPPLDIPIINTEIGSQDQFLFMNPFESFQSSPELCISNLMREDLDQLYIDRVALFVPIVHQGRYSFWTRNKEKSASQTCLQHAMWTLGASLSTQFQHLENPLYTDTKRLLDELESKNAQTEAVDIQLVQALILVAIYEFVRANYCQGWISAGRSFRLVQLMRLYRIDTLDSMHAQGDWIETEEKRRVFWMCYCLDRLASIRNDWPLTLNEQVIMTRLPAPEMEFQSGQPVVMGFLSEVIETTDQSSISPWTECIIMTTILGRALSHRHQTAVANTCVSPSWDFWDRHQLINGVLTERIDVMALKYSSTSQYVDSMILFSMMLAQTTILHMEKTMRDMLCDTDEELTIRMEYKSSALAAAQKLVDLTKPLAQLSSFKVHPFTPIPLYLCAEFFAIHRNPEDCFDPQLQDLSQALKGLKSVNRLAEDFLQLLEFDKDYNDVMQ